MGLDTRMSIRVEVVHALPQRQERVFLDLPNGSSVQDAVQASGLVERLPLGTVGRVGVWGKPVLPDTPLRDLDRVEIYRPLIADAKEVRRDRAAKSIKKYF
jgi:putative ubiquitin-RnfH superfamily antitoxin RatB of RatAB toxin-antitoxin module